MAYPNLTRFTVIRTVHPEPPGNLCATATFRAQVTRGVAIQADLPDEIIELLLRPVIARIEKGVLMHNATPGVRLISTAEIAIDGGFKYVAEFSDVTINERPARYGLSQIIFDALDDDGIFDLKDAAVYEETSRSAPEARGPQGWNITGLHVNLDNEFVFERADGYDLNPVTADASSFIPRAQGRAIAMGFALGTLP